MKTPAPSRSQKKREAKAVETLAGELAALSPREVELIPVDEDIRSEILEAQRISSHGAKKRQIKLLSKRLRGEELGPILEFMEEIKGAGLREAHIQPRLKQLARLILREEDITQALDQAVRWLPDLDTGALESLSRQYRQTGKQRYSREILRILKATYQREEWKRRRTINKEGEPV